MEALSTGAFCGLRLIIEGIQEGEMYVVEIVPPAG